MRAAVAAGKHVYCEWPLARFAPAVQRARELVESGYVGAVNSESVRVAATSHGPTAPEMLAYLYADRNGASVSDIPGGHTIDAMRFIVGDDIVSVRAASSIRYPQITIAETGQTPTPVRRARCRSLYQTESRPFAKPQTGQISILEPLAA